MRTPEGCETTYMSACPHCTHLWIRLTLFGPGLNLRLTIGALSSDAMAKSA